MATKFGKREKIIVGIVIGLVAIFAIHIFVFQDPARKDQELRMRRDQLLAELRNLENAPSQEELAKFEQETVVFEKLLWNAYYGMDIQMAPPFLAAAEPTPLPTPIPSLNPSITPVPIEHDQATIDQYNAQKARYVWESKRILIQVEALLTSQLERLAEMKRTFEAGGPWPGDPNPTPNTIKLSFLEAKPKVLFTDPVGWNMPMKLIDALQDVAALRDEVEQLNDNWEVYVELMDSPAFVTAKLDYMQQLTDMGMDLTTIFALEENSNILAQSQKIMLARLIWKKKPKDDIWFVGNQQLTYELLKEMLNVTLPEGVFGLFDLYTFHHQLSMLDNLILIARKYGIDDIQYVVLPSIHVNYAYPKDLIIEAKKAIDPTAPTVKPQIILNPFANLPQPGLPGRPMGPGGLPMGQPYAPPGYPPRPVVTPLSAFIPDQENVGSSAVVNISYTATNESSIRFLYEAVRDPRYYKIEGLGILTSEEDSGKVNVWLSLSKVFYVAGVSMGFPGELDPLVDPVTFKSRPIISEGGTHAEAEKKARDRDSAVGINEAEVIRIAREDNNITTVTYEMLYPTTPTLTLAPTPTPASAAAPTPAQPL